MTVTIKVIDADKIGSATSPLGLAKTIAVMAHSLSPRSGRRGSCAGAH